MQAGRPGAAVGAQLVYFLIESDQFAVQMIEGTKAEITVLEQLGNGGLPLVNPVDERAHQRDLIDFALPGIDRLPGKTLRQMARTGTPVFFVHD